MYLHKSVDMIIFYYIQNIIKISKIIMLES